MMVTQARCRNCRKLKPLDEEHFARNPHGRGGWRVSCLSCRGTMARAVPDPAPKPPTVSQERARLREAAERVERAREIAVVVLIRRYEAVRFEPGRDREAAYNALARALRSLGRAVLHDGRYWQWDKDLAELKSNVATRTWRAPEDPHADPCRVAWGSHGGPVNDVVEFT